MIGTHAAVAVFSSGAKGPWNVVSSVDPWVEFESHARVDIVSKTVWNNRDDRRGMVRCGGSRPQCGRL